FDLIAASRSIRSSASRLISSSFFIFRMPATAPIKQIIETSTIEPMYSQSIGFAFQPQVDHAAGSVPQPEGERKRRTHKKSHPRQRSISKPRSAFHFKAKIRINAVEYSQHLMEQRRDFDSYIR